MYLVEQLKLSEDELGERVLRSEHRLPAATSLELTAATRKRKPLTPEQLEERRKKVCNVLELFCLQRDVHCTCILSYNYIMITNGEYLSYIYYFTA